MAEALGEWGASIGKNRLRIRLRNAHTSEEEIPCDWSMMSESDQVRTRVRRENGPSSSKLGSVNRLAAFISISALLHALSLSLSLSVTHTHTHSPLVHLTPLYANATPVFLSVEYRFFCFLLLVKWWNELLLCKWAAPIDCVSLTFALLIFSCARSENRLLALVPISISQLSILLPRRSIMIALL